MNKTHTTVWKFEHFSPTIFSQKFRQSNFFTEEVFSKLISRKFFEVGVNFRHFHTVHRSIVEKKSVKSTTVFSIGIVISIIKALLSRNCCHIHVCETQCGKCRNTLTLFCKKFVKAMVLLKKLLNS